MRTLLLFAFFTIFSSQGLVSQNCENLPTAQIDLAVNGVRARITNGGDLWWDGSNSGYAVSPYPGAPADTSAHIMFGGGLWLVGLDPGGGVKMAAQVYGRGAENFDYYPGPLDENGATGPDCGNWDKLFEITRADIESYLDNYDPANPTPDAIPENVAGWPATGNPLFAGIHGFELPAPPHRMAPFFDADEDRRYDPRAGDYPIFCGDQAIWAVFNDAGLHQESHSQNVLQAEVHLLAYAFAAEDETPTQPDHFLPISDHE